MKKSNEKQSDSPTPETGLGLEDFLRQGARQVIQQAIDKGIFTGDMSEALSGLSAPVINDPLIAELIGSPTSSAA